MAKTGGTLYAIRAEGTSLVKIGYTTGSVQKRLKTLQTGQPFPLRVIATVPVETEVRDKEALLHAFLATERRRGEWFELALQSEDFAALLQRAIAFGRDHQKEERAHASRMDPDRREAMQFLGNRVQQRRAQLRLSQMTLARRASMQTRTLQRIERGEINIQGKTLHKLGQALNTSVHYLQGSTHKRTHYCSEGAHPLYQMPCSVCPYQSREQGAVSQEDGHARQG